MPQELSPDRLDGLYVRAATKQGDHCVPIDLERAIESVAHNREPVWLDVVVEDFGAAKRLLQDRLGFSDLAVEDALSDKERPALQEFGDTVFLVMPVVVRENGDERYVELGFFLRECSLTTVSRERLKIVDDWFHRWVNHPGRLSGSAAALLHSLVDTIVDEYFGLVDRLNDVSEELGDRIYGGDVNQVRTIVDLKRRILAMRRQVLPARDVINSLLRRDLDLVPDNVTPYFQDVYDHLLRIGELIDSSRETLTSLLDVHLSTVSNNLNNVVKKMTVFATVLMSMTIVTGIYGMNFDRMPELHWAYGYPFAIGLMIVAGVAILVGFRIAHWI